MRRKVSQNQQPPQMATNSAETGLTAEEAQSRLAKYGENKLVEEREIRFLAILREEITEPMILLLLAIGVLYGFINKGNLTDSLTIIFVVTVLVLAEVWNEYRAKKSITALRKLASPTTVVLRDGKTVEVPTVAGGSRRHTNFETGRTRPSRRKTSRSIWVRSGRVDADWRIVPCCQRCMPRMCR